MGSQYKHKHYEENPVRNIEQELIPSPCCGAHSTNMTRATAVRASDGNRRCARCSNVFSCRIDIEDEDQEEVMRIRSVGRKVQLAQKWVNRN